ncbi:HCP-like protein [Myriangium duriaei CBS 260.36]|uniref:HCP-like protein n=1 Tax=Myriangium duriaei CBS 260.36 TaxID=1168546 RepID=A0A9P4MKI0_9PEZI|nr:HCP-like protein [Myriangium duriaei CBS 260.36]
MKSTVWRSLSLLLLFTWLRLCLAQDAATSSHLDTRYDDTNARSRDDSDQAFVTNDGDESVQNALKLLGRIQPPKLSLDRLSKHKGFLGSTITYAQEAFRLLFLNAPSQTEFTTDTASSRPAKLSSPLAKAVKLLEGAASNHHNPNALWLLAELNFHGNYSHPRNYSTAFSYYNRLADLNGNASAQHMLGFMYATGLGGAVEQDQARALLYHTFAAEQGDIKSQMTVAYRHHVGIGTPRNCNQAVKYYRQVAKKSVEFYKSGPPGGHVLIKNAYRIADETGGFYGEGASVVSAGANARTGGPGSDVYADITDVLEYLDLQSRKGDLRASFNLAKLYYDGTRGLDRDMRQAKALFMQIARMFWKQDGKTKADVSSSVEKLAPRAAGFLGRMFLRGEGTRQSYEKAQLWFKRGIAYGDVLSQYSMGVMYMHGLGVPQDPIKASNFLASAADSNMAVAQTDLGVLFLDQGQVAIARTYFELAIRSGHIEAYYYLAEISDQGLGRERSCGMAAAYYKIAAEMAEVVHSSFIEANEAYETGDSQKALVAWMMAAEQGFENAQANVAWLLDQTKPLYSIRALLSYAIPFVTQKAISATDATLSLIYYTRSARQQNLDSLIKAGDYHLLGLGTTPNSSHIEPSAASSDASTPSSSPPALLNPSPENAAACYQAAYESMRSAQAMWNLGWMHETGTGVEQDYHLAKRYYDLALETNKEAYLPVTLSLYKLRLRSWWNDISHGGVRGIGSDDAPKRKLSFWEFVARFLAANREMEEGQEGVGEAADLAAHGGAGLDDDEFEDRAGEQQRRQQARERGYEEGDDAAAGGEYLANEEMDEGILESLSIILLAGLLAGLVWWRQQRVQRGREEQGQVQGQGQVWPAPDDPDFAPWNAPGGVGH